LQNLKKIYEDISRANRDFAQRLLEAAKKDANINALINLDCLATMIPMTIKSELRERRGYFLAYLE
jgi:hypothetical protein